MAIQDISGTERLIYIDDLTSLFNRRYLYYHLPRELQTAQEQKYTLWVFMLDIDNFKVINDTYGHLCGDEIIKGVANILKESTKDDDKKIRYAGDEFTIIISKLEPKNVLSMAQRLITVISAHPFKGKHSGKDLFVTVSVGIAGFPQDAVSAIELIDLADKSLYISKQKGKNCVSTASEITAEFFWKKDILERFPSPDLLGRESELARLKEALYSVVKFKSKLLLISGELGIGKSRLLNEFEKFVLSQEIIYLSARCEERYLVQPYYILGEALYRYLSILDKLSEDAFHGLSDPELLALFNFMPILNNIYGAPKVKEISIQARDVLGEGLVKFLFSLFKFKPACFVLDDLHYIDSQSLDVISRLTQTDREFPILIVTAFCPEKLPAFDMGVSSLANVINTDKFKSSCETITLSNLSSRETRDMISRIFSQAPFSDDFYNLIYKITKGNPLFVEVLLKYIIGKEYIFYYKGNWIQKEINEASLPSSLEETIRSRIEDLSPEIKEMIAKAAVVGYDFQIDMLQRIDSEDRGYVLDLIEAAKKVGLVYESGALGKDKYSFTSDEIRNVLFKLIGDSRTKNLYSRLGEIMEGLYRDRASDIAGELYYNFKKAQNPARAEQYAKIIREAKGAPYDKTAKHAQPLVSEAQEAVMPLSKEALVVSLDIIRSMYTTSVNYALYPSGSKMRIQSVEDLYQKISRILSEVNIFSIAYVDRNIIINNKRIGRELKNFFSDTFISFLNNQNIKSVIFKKELGKEELSYFIEIINATGEREESLSELLRKSGVSHIEVNEIVYDMQKRKPAEMGDSKGTDLILEYLTEKLQPEDKRNSASQDISMHAQNIAEALEKLRQDLSLKSGGSTEPAKALVMAESIQKAGSQFLEKGPGAWEKYKEELTKIILTMDSQLRADIFAAYDQGPDDFKGGIDILKEFSQGIPDEIIIDILAKQYLKKDNSLARIKSLTQRFLSSGLAKEKLSSNLKDKLKEIGATKDECDWILEDKGWEKYPLEERINKVLTLPSKAFVKMSPIMKIESVVGELLSSEQEKDLEAVLEKTIKTFEENYPDSQSLIGYLKEILGLLIENSPDKLLPKFIYRLLRTIPFNQEGISAEFVSILNPYLDKVIQIFIKSERLALIKETMQVYVKDVGSLKDTTGALEWVAKKLIEDFIRRVDLNLEWRELGEIILLLKPQAVRPLLDAALSEGGVAEGRYFEAYLRRHTIAKLFKEIPRQDFIDIIKEKFSDSRLQIIKNLIEFVGGLDDEEVNKTLEIPLGHPDVSIRKKTIFALGKIKGKESARLLAGALKDEDANLRGNALYILKGRPDSFASQILKTCAQDKDLPEDIRASLL